MAFHIQKTSTVDSDITVYYVKEAHWSDNPAQKKTWASNTSPTNLMVNPDGKNGGWERASVVEE